MSIVEREREVTEMPAVLDPRVERGARLLDEKMPGWAGKIDLDKLSLEHGSRCIRGQLEPVSLEDETVEAWVDNGWYVDVPFNEGGSRIYAALEQDWRLAILSRRQS